MGSRQDAIEAPNKGPRPRRHRQAHLIVAEAATERRGLSPEQLAFRAEQLARRPLAEEPKLRHREEDDGESVKEDFQ